MSERKTTTSCCGSDDESNQLDTLHENRPSLPTLSYRLGRHGDFFRRMLGRLPGQRSESNPDSKAPLARLTYRGTDDPTVAVLDACASMLDVLSFYQERIVNEGYVRTALERRSMLELARAIGYEMSPGVAASTLLAFTIDETPDTTDIVTVPSGTQVLSIPKKDESPKTYETIETIEARPEWNSIAVSATRLTLTPGIARDTPEVFIDRLGLRVRPGDPLLFVYGDAISDRVIRWVSSVEDVPGRGYRRVVLQGSSDVPAGSDASVVPELHGFRKRSNLFGHNAPEPRSRLVDVERIICFRIETPVTCVAFSPDGAVAAAGFTAIEPPPDPRIREPHSTLRVWDIADPSAVRAIEIFSTITAVAFSADGRYLTASDTSGTTHVWDATDGSPIANNEDAAERTAVTAIVFGDPHIEVYDPPLDPPLDPPPDPPGNLLTVGEDGTTTHQWYFAPPDPDAGLAGSLYSVYEPVTTSFAIDPLIARTGDQELEGRADGTVVYRFRGLDVPEPLPDKIALDGGRVDLARVQSTLVPGGWSLLVDPDQTQAYPITDVSVIQREEFGLRRRISSFIASTDLASDPTQYSLRQTEVYTESVGIPLADLGPPLYEPVEGNVVSLADIELDDAMVQSLQGRTVIVQGRPAGRRLEDDYAEYVPHPPDETYRFPVTAIAEDGSQVSLTVEKPNDPSGWRLVDENGFTFGLSGPPNVAAQSDDDDIVQEAAKITLISSSPAKLTFADALQKSYDWHTVRITANVAQATHGEAVEEVLGSGDGLVANQGFRLKKPPLTYIPAANERGRASTLEVRVNGVVWRESDSLLMTEPADETFIVRVQDNGASELTFGDGLRGARLPSGAENITARYRSGIGPDGELDAGQLSLLKTRPLGVSEVSNPLPATGSAAAERQSEARENAPRTVLVLGRVVSIQDYEDFAKSFPGIGKAQAVAMWDGATKLVHLTVGTESGETIERASPTYDSLLGALDRVRDINQLMVIDGFIPIHFGVCAQVLIDRRYEAASVLRDVEQHLAVRFDYDQRTFGQDIAASEIIAAIHAVEGIIAVDLDALFFVTDSDEDDGSDSDDTDTDTTSYQTEACLADGVGDSAPTQQLQARTARLVDRQPQAAELLLIHPNHIDIKEMT